jgi:hypothetical protein
VGDVLETVLDWRPFDYYTVEMRITPGRFNVMQTSHLEATSDGGTKLKVYYRLQNSRMRWMARPFSRMLVWFLDLELKRLKRILAS